jgi:hypothetical protein
MNIDTIVKLEKELEIAMLSSDVEKLDKLLDDKIVFTNHTGEQTSKQNDLEAHRYGFIKIDSISQSNQTVNLFDNVAVVTVLCEIYGLFGEMRSTAKIYFTRVWQKKLNEEYKLIAAHSSLKGNA